MKSVGWRKCVALLSGFLFFVSALGCASRSASSAEIAEKPETTHEEKGASIPAFELPAPSDKASQDYLGVSGTGAFKITDIKATVVIIEVFNMYCPHCQKEAPQVNELYQAIHDDPALNSKIKLIGIGVGNTPYEVDLFREKYGVLFPLFPDQEMTIGRMLSITGTPTFIGARLDPDGSHRKFYFKSGYMGGVPEFLDTILALSGLAKEM